jgi:hypothetical protein
VLVPLGTEDFAAAASLEGVPSALAAARDGIDSLLRDRGLRRTTPELTADSLLRGAAASAALEGSSTSLVEMRAGTADALAAGAARLNGQLLSLVPVIGRAPLQALARMQALTAPPDAPKNEVGRPRAEPGIVVALQALSEQLLTTEAPALAVACLAHATVVTLAPFESGNGLVGRGLERLLLVARGVDPTSLTVPEGGHLASGAAYRDALRAYAEDGAAGRRRWLLYAADAVSVGASLSPLRS